MWAGVGRWPGTLPGWAGNFNLVSACSSYPGCSSPVGTGAQAYTYRHRHTHTQVLPSLQGNRSLPKEAQGSHYITWSVGWGGH